MAEKNSKYKHKDPAGEKDIKYLVCPGTIATAEVPELGNSRVENPIGKKEITGADIANPNRTEDLVILVDNPGKNEKNGGEIKGKAEEKGE